ncbi:MAG: GPI anchored serine-threonine rich family protein [Cyclobacteriaceae bacterium]|nr:GPI anchored serine-threonine rich family protein [Cyclobacteriaceae bacterium]
MTEGLFVRVTVLFILSILFFTASAQTVENVQAFIKGDIIEIHYNLKPGIDSLNCDVSVYSSHNQFSSPLLWVSGHVGQHIAPGDGKLIIWEARKELENYKGEIIIEVRAEPIVPPYRFLPNTKIKARPGKPFTIAWEGGKKTDVIDIQLLDKNKAIVKVLESGNNNAKYVWNIPKNFKKETYYIRLLVPGGELVSEPFKVQSSKKWLLAIPAIGGIGLVIGLLGEKEEILPEPPGPPDNN